MTEDSGLFLLLHPFLMTEPLPDSLDDKSDVNLSDNSDDKFSSRLYPEDQAKVDAFTRGGINAVERKPFRPFRLALILMAVVFGLGLFSQMLPRWFGIY